VPSESGDIDSVDEQSEDKTNSNKMQKEHDSFEERKAD
jgi:hypothetical protein